MSTNKFFYDDGYQDDLVQIGEHQLSRSELDNLAVLNPAQEVALTRGLWNLERISPDSPDRRGLAFVTNVVVLRLPGYSQAMIPRGISMEEIGNSLAYSVDFAVSRNYPYNFPVDEDIDIYTFYADQIKLQQARDKLLRYIINKLHYDNGRTIGRTSFGKTKDNFIDGGKKNRAMWGEISFVYDRENPERISFVVLKDGESDKIRWGPFAVWDRLQSLKTRHTLTKGEEVTGEAVGIGGDPRPVPVKSFRLFRYRNSYNGPIPVSEIMNE